MSIKRLLGIDTLQEKYAYAKDPRFGYTSAAKIPEKWVATTCGYCSVGCGIEIGVKEGKAVTVRANEAHPVNIGKLCPKGLAEHQIIDVESRAKQPLLRKNGKLEPVSWDEALDRMIVEFKKVQERYGKKALGVVSTGQLVTEEFYALGKLVQLGFDTNNYDGNTTLCMASAVSGYKRSFGSDGPPGAYDDLEQSDVIILVGANIADNHPILCYRLERNPDKKLVVIDPRVSKTARMADLHLPIKPRTDIALLNGIAHILIRSGLVDKEYIEAHTNGYAELEKHLEKYTPERVAQVTGLSEETIYRTALLYGRAKAPLIAWTMGVNHSTQGAETVNVINNLALLTGNIGKAGAAPLSITGQCNAMGSREASGTSSLPGYRKFESQQDREDLARLWNVDASELPTARGHAYPDIVEACVKEEIKALWIIATNPMVSFPNVDVLKQGLDNLDFLVVQDGYHPTPTTEVADLVLPAAIWGEKEGTYTNTERRVSKVNPAVAPPGEAKSDFDIFLAIAQKLGMTDKLFPGWTGPRDAFDEWRKVSAGRLCDYSGIDYDMLGRHFAVQWPLTTDQAQQLGDDAPPTSRLYSDGQFETDDGRAILFSVEWEPFPEQPTQSFPFVLNTGRTVEHWHTRTKTKEAKILERMSPTAWLEMNPRDARKLNLKPHDRVSIVSPRSRVDDVELRITEIVAPGQVFMPFHYFERNSNLLTQSAFDPISREPNYKQSSVRVEKTSASLA
ncbi:MAG: nitrate reductase [Bryobacterales bacterium]|nr:nitrate reductase [Bryobacterales bacterium]